MYAKCSYTKLIPHFDKLLYTKCIQNVFIQNVPQNRVTWTLGVTWTKLKKLHLSLKFINSSNIW